MRDDDSAFLDECCDPARRPAALRRWQRARRLSLAAAALFLVLALVALLAGLGSLCGLFAGVSAINYAAATAADTKVKLGLLVARLGKVPAGAEG